eukprot:SAG11_NODE_7418_length_1147_cov_1.065840_1_plen_200_part_00
MKLDLDLDLSNGVRLDDPSDSDSSDSSISPSSGVPNIAYIFQTCTIDRQTDRRRVAEGAGRTLCCTAATMAVRARQMAAAAVASPGTRRRAVDMFLSDDSTDDISSHNSPRTPTSATSSGRARQLHVRPLPSHSFRTQQSTDFGPSVLCAKSSWICCACVACGQLWRTAEPESARSSRRACAAPQPQRTQHGRSSPGPA